MKRILATLVLPLMLCGCVHNVGYKLTEQDRWTGPKIDGVLCVKPIIDHAPAITNQQETIENATWRTNYRKGYAKTNLTDETTAMIVKHLSHSGLFTKVVSGTDTSAADWTLSGSLTAFESHGKVNSTAETVEATTAGMGLIGAIAGSVTTANMTSTVWTKVKLDDLHLQDKSGQLLWHNSITVSNCADLDFHTANEYAIFHQTDAGLKLAVSNLVYQLGNSPLTNSVKVAKAPEKQASAK